MLYPQIDPVLFSIGPISIHWYGTLYLISFFGCWAIASSYSKRAGMSSQGLADLLFYVALGVVLGGRVGYVLFYQPEVMLSDPLALVRIWEGGRSFHGGLIGVLLSCWLYGRRRGFTFFEITDLAAPCVPLGLGLGRLGNFINTELPGRVTEVPWGFRYPCEAVYTLNPECIAFGSYEMQLRHPSSLYQFFLEGVVMLTIMLIVNRKKHPIGIISGVFAMLYGVLRLVSEVFRSPDAHIGMLFGEFLTLGQILSLPMLFLGALIFYWAKKRGRYVG